MAAKLSCAHPAPSAVLALCALLPGCAVGPDYHPPRPILPAHWQAARDPAAALEPATDAGLQTWWRSFHDPVLDRLMAAARTGNLDLKIALARVGQARAERHASRAGLFPQVSANAVGARLDNLFPVSQPGGSKPLDFFLAGFDAVWEIDVFGRLGRKLEAATAEAEAATEDYRQTWVILCAELARDYTEYRNLRRQLDIVQAHLAAQRHTLELTGQLYREGLATGDVVARAEAQAGDTAARVPALEAQLTEAQHRLEILVGAKPGALASRLAGPGGVPGSDARTLLTTPAETLRRRPDVRGAERALAAATALQGAAFAELFPKISVAAFAGLHNSDLESLFRSSAFAWAGGASLAQPIFNFGRIRAGMDLADARQQAAYFNYERTVLSALHETETALARFLKEERRREQLAVSVGQLQEALRQVDARYRAGLATYLEVLDAQRASLSEESALADSQARTTAYLIALYKALGGAGQGEAEPAEEPIRPWG
ncbi:efflux transporter outer membrane subunit [Methylomagnum ishizawai]|uniref:efflux transporter outer membrane subunit n=1 Tax=Methylomagnum ishizawai TaxID=1760988 RepID=UPI001C3320D2|nr:efflux transporter outer membrane subunit [Methylomagnum ishizawai]BBL77090.1 RND transporter [Methylomagnum ishizawai]